MIRKIYWHELTDEQRLDTWEKAGLKFMSLWKNIVSLIGVAIPKP